MFYLAVLEALAAAFFIFRFVETGTPWHAGIAVLFALMAILFGQQATKE